MSMSHHPFIELAFP